MKNSQNKIISNLKVLVISKETLLIEATEVDVNVSPHKFFGDDNLMVKVSGHLPYNINLNHEIHFQYENSFTFELPDNQKALIYKVKSLPEQFAHVPKEIKEWHSYPAEQGKDSKIRTRITHLNQGYVLLFPEDCSKNRIMANSKLLLKAVNALDQLV